MVDYSGYRPDSVEGRFLAGKLEAVAEVGRWVAQVLAAPTFWSLRSEWNDLHQEVLGRVVESLRRRRFDREKDFRTYVQGIARFAGFKAIGRHVQGASDTELDPDMPEPAGGEDQDPEQRIIESQLARQVLETASDECRSLITRYFMRERRYQEIAEELSLPVGTVKSRLFRCMENIHKLLDV